MDPTTCTMINQQEEGSDGLTIICILMLLIGSLIFSCIEEDRLNS
jgi:hypothetical protein